MIGRYIFKYLVPGIALIGIGFFAGSQKDFMFGLFGFLAFFVMGVTLVVEGYRKEIAGGKSRRRP